MALLCLVELSTDGPGCTEKTSGHEAKGAGLRDSGRRRIMEIDFSAGASDAHFEQIEVGHEVRDIGGALDEGSVKRL
jgi:hypothetical protein